MTFSWLSSAVESIVVRAEVRIISSWFNEINKHEGYRILKSLIASLLSRPCQRLGDLSTRTLIGLFKEKTVKSPSGSSIRNCEQDFLFFLIQPATYFWNKSWLVS